MKRAIAVLALSAMLMGVCATGLSEAGQTLHVKTTYEGAWVAFAEQGFKLYLPMGWMMTESGDAAFVLVNAETKQAMWIDAYEAGEATVDGLLAYFQAEASFENVRAVYFNGVAFVTYASPGSDLFGAATFSADGSMIYFFKFTPYGDGALETLATQILSTLSPLE